MSEEIVVQQPTEIMVPGTGEVVNLDDPSSCAYALHALRDFKQQIDNARYFVEQALVRHAQDSGTKTLHVGDLTATVSGGKAVRWDVEELQKLMDAGLPETRFNELVKTEVSYKINAAVAKSIEAAGNPEYAEIIGRARSYDDVPWRVSVK